MTIFDQTYMRDLFIDCALRGRRRSCKTLALYQAVSGLVVRLQEDLKVRLVLDPPVKPPGGSGPDPAPNGQAHRFGGDGDASDPTRLFPTAGFLADPQRLKGQLEAAIELQNALKTVVESLDQEIREIKRGPFVAQAVKE